MRALDINPRASIDARRCFFLPETQEEFDFRGYDYVVDAVDNVTAKLLIIRRAREAGVPVISAMGAGNKLRPDLFKVASIEETSVCPLARVMRRELRKLGISGVKVVFSTEQPQKRNSSPKEGAGWQKRPGKSGFCAGGGRADPCRGSHPGSDRQAGQSYRVRRKRGKDHAGETCGKLWPEEKDM